MNRIKFVIEVIDTVIRVAQLIKSELKKKEIDSDEENESEKL
jgi:hypothetical protein